MMLAKRTRDSAQPGSCTVASECIKDRRKNCQALWTQLQHYSNGSNGPNLHPSKVNAVLFLIS